MRKSGPPDPGSVGAIGPALMRLGAIFVAVCMVIIAGSAGAIVYLYLGVSASEAATKAGRNFPGLQLFTVGEVFGGWTAAQKKHFDDSGTFDQLYPARR